jgi:hypothetical protein
MRGSSRSSEPFPFEVYGGYEAVSEEQHPEGLSQEELDALSAEELPQREALSVLRVPFLGTAPVEAADPELPLED